jgi:tRNA dimethylallyltransferase
VKYPLVKRGFDFLMQHSKANPCLVCGAVVGATGAGKSKFAVRLAKSLGAKIISVDSRQVYKGFSIGTAQVQPQDQGGIEHFLMNFLNPEIAYSAGDFLKDVHAISQSNQGPFLLVGGTGFYLRSLMDGIIPEIFVNPEVRSTIQKQYKENGLTPLVHQLQALDPGAITKIDVCNPIRVMRALEVCQSPLPDGSYVLWSQLQSRRSGGIGAIPIIWKDPKREVLYPNIDTRTNVMFKNGWIEEVEALMQQYTNTEIPGFLSLGYREIVQFLQQEKEGLASDANIPQLVQKIQKNTRNYAKRQLTFFRNQFVDCEILQME